MFYSVKIPTFESCLPDHCIFMLAYMTPQDDCGVLYGVAVGVTELLAIYRPPAIFSLCAGR